MGKHNIDKISVIHKDIYRCNAISIKISRAFFSETVKSILKFILNLKGYQIAKKNLERKEQNWRSHIFLLQNISYSIKTGMKCGTDMKTDIYTNGLV